MLQKPTISLDTLNELMSNETHDWSYFIKKEYFNATKEHLFQMWIQPTEIVKYWLSDAKYFTQDGEERDQSEAARQGDNYEWHFYSGLIMRGKILEVNENDIFKFTFGSKYQGSDEKVVVTISFHEDENDTWIEILQENIGETEWGKVNYYVSCNLGWRFALINLKSVVEHGNDLRQKDIVKNKETQGITLQRIVNTV